MATEKRLIDANALADEVDNSRHNNPHPPGRVRVNHMNEHSHFIRMILDAPTVDAVEVVRCKNCKYWSGYGGRCKHWGSPLAGTVHYTNAEDFCSYGERRTDNV